MPSVISPSGSELAQGSAAQAQLHPGSLAEDSPEFLTDEVTNPITELDKFFAELRPKVPEPWQAEYDRAEAIALDEQLDVGLLAVADVEFFVKNKIKLGAAFRIVKA